MFGDPEGGEPRGVRRFCEPENVAIPVGGGIDRRFVRIHDRERAELHASRTLDG
jgi:hypothetical protein